MQTTEIEHFANLSRRRAIRRRLYSIHPFCSLCHERIRFSTQATLDHVVPLSRGGTDDIGNLDLCCRACNSFKASRTPAEFVTILEMVLDNMRLRAEATF